MLLVVWSIFWVIFSFLFSLLLIPLCIRIAFFTNILDRPDGKLKQHAQPTPYLGGLSLLAATLVPMMIYVPKLVPGLLVLFFLGLIDDIICLRPWMLFLGHSISAVCLLLAGCVAPIFAQSFVNYGFSFFWLVSIINAFNLIDVMDGLTAIVCLCSCYAFSLFALLLQHNIFLPPISALFGALGGFFWYNKPSARIFLGGAGSLFLGGFFGALSLSFMWTSGGISYFFIPSLLLIVPIAEITALIGIRLSKGVPFYCGSPDHFSLYLQRDGWSKWTILGFTSGVSSLGLLVSLLFFFNIIRFKELFFIVAFPMVLWWRYLVKRM